jgi:putative Mg2+ transporter-C (MgtC) family protein
MFSGTFETETPMLEIGLRMLAAISIGGLIGFERELRARAAGLRTNMLVALSAATFTLLTAELASEAQEASSVIRMDPMRLMEAVIAGVAFLGAGAIIRSDGGAVRGLTTGASLWMSGAIGVASGGGYYVLALGAGVMSILVLYVVGMIERRTIKGGDRRDGA